MAKAVIDFGMLGGDVKPQDLDSEVLIELGEELKRRGFIIEELESDGWGREKKLLNLPTVVLKKDIDLEEAKKEMKGKDISYREYVDVPADLSTKEALEYMKEEGEIWGENPTLLLVDEEDEPDKIKMKKRKDKSMEENIQEIFEKQEEKADKVKSITNEVIKEEKDDFYTDNPLEKIADKIYNMSKDAILESVNDVLQGKLESAEIMPKYGADQVLKQKRIKSSKPQLAYFREKLVENDCMVLLATSKGIMPMRTLALYDKKLDHKAQEKISKKLKDSSLKPGDESNMFF